MIATREKGRGAIYLSTGVLTVYLAIVLLGSEWRGRHNSSRGDRKSERGRAWAWTPTLSKLGRKCHHKCKKVDMSNLYTLQSVIASETRRRKLLLFSR
jgi:hypothetical protein